MVKFYKGLWHQSVMLSSALRKFIKGEVLIRSNYLFKGTYDSVDFNNLIFLLIAFKVGMTRFILLMIILRISINIILVSRHPRVFVNLLDFYFLKLVFHLFTLFVH